jgi:cytoskeletal protein CcmA (bactofilin family)
MAVLLIVIGIWHSLYAETESFFKPIPEIGKTVPTFKNQTIETIKSKASAIICNVTAQVIEVKGKLGIKNVIVKRMECAGVIATIHTLQADSLILNGSVAGNTIKANVLTINGSAMLKMLKAAYFTMKGICYLENSEIGELDITTRKLSLRKCRVQTLRVSSYNGRVPVVELQDSEVGHLIFLDKTGEVQKKGDTKITYLENASLR